MIFPAWVFYMLGVILVVVAIADTVRQRTKIVHSPRCPGTALLCAWLPSACRHITLMIRKQGALQWRGCNLINSLQIYVTILFARGHVEKMWPVKLLVVMVEALVTTTFSTIFGWVRSPLLPSLPPVVSMRVCAHQIIEIPGRFPDDLGANPVCAYRTCHFTRLFLTRVATFAGFVPSHVPGFSNSFDIKGPQPARASWIYTRNQNAQHALPHCPRVHTLFATDWCPSVHVM